MQPITKEVLNEYFSLYREIKNLEARKKDLSDKIIAYMQEDKLEIIESEVGRINLTKQMRWSYDEATKNAVQLVYSNAKNKGTAKQKESVFLTTTIK